MKKIFFCLIFSLFITTAGFSQYFQGTFTNTGSTLIFKMKPTAALTTQISYLELCFRYVTASLNPFTTSDLVNGTQVIGINMQRKTDYVMGDYTYIRFVHNTGTIPNFSYQAGTEYEIFQVNLVGSGTGNFEMASDLVDPNNETVFGVVDGAGNLILPTGNQLYGTGFSIQGNVHILPLLNVVLPVKFALFDVIKKANDAMLNWNVENEGYITDHYEIERSLNGIDFTRTGSVAGKNNGNSRNTYTSTDYNLSSLRSAAGVIYYRIKQVDKDGRFIYSEIRSVKMDGKTFAASVYPNPVKNEANLVIDITEAAMLNIVLTDAAGKEINKIILDGIRGLNTYPISMNKLAAGTYFIRVDAGNESKTLSVIKNK